MSQNEIKSYLQNVTKLMRKELPSTDLLTPKRCFSVEEFVLTYGMPFKKTVPTLAGAMGDCYKNATKLAQEKNWRYVEGYAITEGLPIPLLYAWCLDENGNVSDPTWADGVTYYGIIFSMSYQV